VLHEANPLLACVREEVVSKIREINEDRVQGTKGKKKEEKRGL